MELRSFLFLSLIAGTYGGFFWKREATPFSQEEEATNESGEYSRTKRGDAVIDGGGAKIVSLSELEKGGNNALPPTVHYGEIKKREAEVESADMAEYARVKRAASVENGGAATLVSVADFGRDNALPPLTKYSKRAVDNSVRIDKLAEADRGLTLDGDNREKRSIEDSEDDDQADLPDDAPNTSEGSESDEGDDLTEGLMNGLSPIGRSATESNSTVAPAPKQKWNLSRHVLPKEEVKEDSEVDGSGEDTDGIRVARWAGFRSFFGFGDGEGSGEEETPRETRDTESATSSAVLGSEQPVVNQIAVQGTRRRDEDEDREDRHRPRPPTSTPGPELTCETVDCIRGMQCVMENGRPTCRSMPGQQQQRTCRDINCPRDSRCTMEREPRCRGWDCPEQPVCVRESRPSCNAVQCPSGTRCRVMEEPGCRFRCREVATCVNPCEGVSCPFGSACRFDNRDTFCAPISFDPCASARCPGGFECRSVQNQARCFPVVNTPAPTLPPTTTPIPVSCLGQNEEFATCATFCEPTCVEKNPACILACAAPRCQCANGFYRNNQGICVPAEQCEFTPSCPQNEIFNQCASRCEPRCGQPLLLACPAICDPPKCQCKPGFWRHPSGSCVQQNQCFSG